MRANRREHPQLCVLWRENVDRLLGNNFPPAVDLLDRDWFLHRLIAGGKLINLSDIGPVNPGGLGQQRVKGRSGSEVSKAPPPSRWYRNQAAPRERNAVRPFARPVWRRRRSNAGTFHPSQSIPCLNMEGIGRTKKPFADSAPGNFRKNAQSGEVDPLSGKAEALSRWL